MRYGQRIRKLFLLALALPFFGCGEESSVETPPDEEPGVVIAGEAYPVVAVAGRQWTGRNYRGPGGKPYRSGEDRSDYGRYYTSQELQAIPLPSGWRIPTVDDYRALASSQGVVFTGEGAASQAEVSRLASTTGWLNVQGTNESGFDAYPGGYCFGSQDPIAGDIAEFWAAGGITFSILESASKRPHRIAFYQSNDSGYRFNVRFVKDDP